MFARLDPPGPLRFFTPEEEPTLRAFCDVVLAQDDEPRVPVAEMVDAKLADGDLDGYRYADMPRDPETWRTVLGGLDHTARAAYRRRFAELPAERRENIVREFAEGRLVGGPWETLNVTRAWSVVMRAVLAQFYAHPWAWNEIGFGGPAYPRGSCGWAVRGQQPGAVRETGRGRGGPGAGERLMGTFWRGLLKGAVGPRDNDSRYLLDVHRRDLPGEATMRRYGDDDEVDLVVVGAGAGARCWPSGWPAAAGALWSSRRARSGTPTRTGCPTRPAATPCTGPRTG